MRITFSTGAFPALPIKTSFHMAEAVGADGLELMLTPRLVQTNPEKLRRLESEMNIPIRSVHSVLRLRPGSPERVSADIINSARFAAQLPSCEVMVVHTPETDRLHSHAARSWFQAIEMAQVVGGGVQIAIENSGVLTKHSPAYVATKPDEILRLAQEWGLGVTFDTAHAASRDWDLRSSLTDLLPYVLNVHLSDYGSQDYLIGMANALLRDHRLPGTGVLPIPSLLADLAHANYDGLITLEVSPLAIHTWWLPTARHRLETAIVQCRNMAQLVTWSHKSERRGHAQAE